MLKLKHTTIKHLHAIAEKQIEKEGVFDVVKIYSSEDIRQGKAYKSIIEKGIVPTAKKPVILLATSYIYEGISIYNEDVGQIAFFGENSKENIKQGIARFRTVSKQDVNIFLAINSKQNTGSFEDYESWHFGQYCEVFKGIKDTFN